MTLLSGGGGWARQMSLLTTAAMAAARGRPLMQCVFCLLAQCFPPHRVQSCNVLVCLTSQSYAGGGGALLHDAEAWCDLRGGGLLRASLHFWPSVRSCVFLILI